MRFNSADFINFVTDHVNYADFINSADFIINFINLSLSFSDTYKINF